MSHITNAISPIGFGATDPTQSGSDVVIRPSTTVVYAWWALSTASMAVSAFHGYRRNNSVGWALVWGLLGATFPVIVPTIALAEGFGKPKKA